MNSKGWTTKVLISIGIAVISLVAMLAPRCVAAALVPETLLPKMPVYQNEYHVNVPIVMRVVTVDTQEEMIRLFAEAGGTVLPDQPPISFAQSGIVEINGVDTRVCVIYTRTPIYYFDEAWYYWGHELGHCVYGQWHPYHTAD